MQCKKNCSHNFKEMLVPFKKNVCGIFKMFTHKTNVLEIFEKCYTM